MLVPTPEISSFKLSLLERIWLLQRELAPRLNEPKVWTGSLRRQALVRSIRFSVGIEGYRASDSQANEVLLGSTNSGLEQSTLDAVTGYRQAMGLVLALATRRDFVLDETFIRAVHFMALSSSSEKSAGLYRSGPIFVQDDRTGRTVHEGASADAISSLMREFASRYSSTQEPSLIAGAMAHLNLVLIHPFNDGNGRVARILQSAILAGEEKPSPLFLSIEEFLGINTQRYYEVLSEVGGGRWNPNADATPWIRFVLDAHLQQLDLTRAHWDRLNLSWRLVSELASSEGLNDRIVPALAHVVAGNKLNNTIYRELLKEAGDLVSMLTASRDLALLVEKDLLEPTGDNRAREYRAGSKLRQLNL